MRIGDRLDTDEGLYVVTMMNDERVRLTRFDDEDDVITNTVSDVRRAVDVGSWERDGYDYSLCDLEVLWSELADLSELLEEAAFEFGTEVQPIEESVHSEDSVSHTLDLVVSRLEPASNRCQELSDRMEAIINEVDERAV